MLTTDRPPAPLIQRVCDLERASLAQDVAAKLGVSHGHWSHLKRGERVLTARVIQAIRRAYPELEGECIAALLRLGERS